MAYQGSSTKISRSFQLANALKRYLKNLQRMIDYASSIDQFPEQEIVNKLCGMLDDMCAIQDNYVAVFRALLEPNELPTSEEE